MHMNNDFCVCMCVHVCVCQLPIIFSLPDKKTNSNKVFQKNIVLEFCHLHLKF
jgi:hypothetical protein